MSAVTVDLPRNAAQVARRLQRRLSGFALVLGVLCRDVNTLQHIVEILRAGFGLSDDERQELDEVAVRLFDAREMLNERD
ncbi:MULTISPECIES: hypothetical protein [unclassified Pseudoxanthomonas]|uniref:hypothetical protein n=1 Tax=unclassified Pseudoxanthomonas TaxID=2645906 RepID=UPI0030770117